MTTAAEAWFSTLGLSLSNPKYRYTAPMEFTRLNEAGNLTGRKARENEGNPGAECNRISGACAVEEAGHKLGQRNSDGWQSF